MATAAAYPSADTSIARRLGLGGRVALVVLALWALAVVAPDLRRVLWPLGSLGFSADNSGLIYDVQGAFAASESPAWRAGLRVGDHLDLAAMRCIPLTNPGCVSLLSVLGGGGGSQLVWPDRRVMLEVIGPNRTRRSVTVTAAIPETGWDSRLVLLLCELAAIFLILAAGWLVWTRPSAMTWGFFLYELWFNPGQPYVAYALLQTWPAGLLAQQTMQALAEAVGYGGFLIFALRVPGGHPDPGWRPAERIVPAVMVVLAALQLAAFANPFGFRTEPVARAGYLAGYAVALAALVILLRRRRGLPPQEYQRLRWVIWGCLIGLPAFIFADSNATTTLWWPVWHNGGPSDTVLGLCYLANGILCGFVLEAVRRRRVIDVAIPLRRITLLTLLISMPVFWAAEEISMIQHSMGLPGWAWLALGGLIAFLLGKVHEATAHMVHHVLDPPMRRAHHHLRRAQASLAHARGVAEIERMLVEAPAEALRLSSAALFRQEADGWQRCCAIGWPEVNDTAELAAQPAIAAWLRAGCPLRLRHHLAEAAGLPSGLAAPSIGLLVGDGLAVVFYGPHRTGADLNLDERELLVEFVKQAAQHYAAQEIAMLRRRVATLESGARSATAVA